MQEFIYANRAWILPACFILMILAIAWYFSDYTECPREIMGYDCRGSRCDHSREAISKAKEVMGRDYWHGGK